MALKRAVMIECEAENEAIIIVRGKQLRELSKKRLVDRQTDTVVEKCLDR